MKRGRIITIGSFDGVHRGHQSLIEQAVKAAKKRKIKSLALTFTVPPKMFFDVSGGVNILSTPQEKEWLLRSFHIDQVQWLEFNRSFSRVSPFIFFRDVLMGQYNAKGLVVGSDFRFGLNRTAGALELVRWGEDFDIPVWVMPPVKWNKKIVSSSLIREQLRTQRFKTGLSLLNHPYLVSGGVVRGRGWGRRLGFPTANLRVAKEKILPRGVFSVRGWVLNKKSRYFFKGVCNIGVKPTMQKRGKCSVEVHFLKPPPYSLHGKFLMVELLTRTRSEKKFRSKTQLISAIRKDVLKAKQFFKKYALN